MAGALKITRERDEVRIDCRWPFDLQEDEWIYIVTDVSVTDFIDCLEALRVGEASHVDGIRGGFIELAPHRDGGSSLEVADRFGRAPTRLQFILTESPEELGTAISTRL